MRPWFERPWLHADWCPCGGADVNRDTCACATPQPSLRSLTHPLTHPLAMAPPPSRFPPGVAAAHHSGERGPRRRAESSGAVHGGARAGGPSRGRLTHSAGCPPRGPHGGGTLGHGGPRTRAAAGELPAARGESRLTTVPSMDLSRSLLPVYPVGGRARIQYAGRL
jgi:hypothetical protein